MKKDKDIEQKLKSSFEQITPDVLDSILSDAEEGKGQNMTNIQPKKSTRRAIEWVAAIAACLTLCIGGTFAATAHNASKQVAALVSIDVNPSIELSVNKDDKVIDVSAANDDAKDILEDDDYSGAELKAAVDKIIDVLMQKGYLDGNKNSVLISVDSDDEEFAAALQQKLMEDINAYFSLKGFKGSVICQDVDHDDSVSEIADKYDISLGKATLIRKIIAAGSTYTAEQLSKMTISEINFIMNADNIEPASITKGGTAVSEKYVSRDTAKAKAFAAAGVNPSEVSHLKISLDFDDDDAVYEVEFRAGGNKYEYEIDAITGTITDMEKSSKIDEDSDDDDQDEDADEDNDSKYENDQEDQDDQGEDEDSEDSEYEDDQGENDDNDEEVDENENEDHNDGDDQGEDDRR